MEPELINGTRSTAHKELFYKIKDFICLLQKRSIYSKFIGEVIFKKYVV
jgi:hypothetical protein